jgi:hypothetical protein
MSRYHKVLLGIFLAVWAWSAVRPKYPHDWLLENILVLIFAPSLFLRLASRFRPVFGGPLQ